jgi:hypothetical protein
LTSKVALLVGRAAFDRAVDVALDAFADRQRLQVIQLALQEFDFSFSLQLFEQFDDTGKEIRPCDGIQAGVRQFADAIDGFCRDSV